MPAMEWSDVFVLGVDKMDATHREFVDLVNALAAAADAEFLPRLDNFIAHTAEHFEQENRWMGELGFPAVHCHTSEHERVLNVVKAVRQQVEAGDIALGRRLAEELPPWFDNHAATMDAVLAHYIKTESAAPAEVCGCASPSQ